MERLGFQDRECVIDEFLRKLILKPALEFRKLLWGALSGSAL